MRHLLLIGILAVILVAGCGNKQAEYEARNGDIIFHTSTSAQSEAIQKVTGSPISHVGIVWIERGIPVVLEAVGPVKATGLKEWIARGEGGRFAVRRLKAETAPPTAAEWQRVRGEYEKLRGLPYDPCFAWSDEAMYCSEFVYKLYRRGLRVMLAAPRPLDRYDLSDPEIQAVIKRTCPEGFAEHEFVVPPDALYESDKLETVVSDFDPS